jgi:hypothetical protein
MIGYWAAGLWTSRVNGYLRSPPAVLLAIVIGRWTSRRLDGGRFLIYVHTGLPRSASVCWCKPHDGMALKKVAFRQPRKSHRRSPWASRGCNESATRLTTMCGARAHRERLEDLPTQGGGGRAIYRVHCPSAAPVFAHNERIHQADRLRLPSHAAMAAVSAGDTTITRSSPSWRRCSPIIPICPRSSAQPDSRGRSCALRSGPRRPDACFDPDLLALVDDDNDLLPDWQLAAIAEEKMGRLNYPITTRCP